MRPETKERWLKVLRDQIQSGLSFEDYANKHGYKHTTLRQYYYELRNELPPRPRSNARKKKKREDGKGSENGFDNNRKRVYDSVSRVIDRRFWDNVETVDDPTILRFKANFFGELDRLKNAHQRNQDLSDELPIIAMFGKAIVENDNFNCPKLKAQLRPIVDLLESGFLGSNDKQRVIANVVEMYDQVRRYDATI